MKSYQYKLIIAFFIIGSLIILTLCGLYLFLPPMPPHKVLIMATIAIIILLVACILMDYIAKKKVIDPMSRMLKGAVEKGYSAKNNENSKSLENIENDDDIETLVATLKVKLKEANDSRKQTETILTHMTDGVIAFDMDENVTYINEAAIEMLGLSEKDTTFDKIFKKYNDPDINMEKIIYLDNWTSSDKKISNENGSVELFFVPFKDEVNMPNGLMVMIQDITEHVKLDNMRNQFVADVSHELKTPLTSIKGFSETLLEDDCDAETEKHFLGIINENANRMEEMVADLLTLSKYDTKRVDDATTEFDLGELAKHCKEKFDIEISKKDLDVHCNVINNVPLVRANKKGIERVILNIISNSVKYTEDGGKIDIYVGCVHNDAYVKVKDTGIGIPEEDLDKVFERFYRVDKARSRAMGGTGLGLSIAKEIIEQNKGSISVKSKVGEGTEFTISIPTINSKK